MLTHSRRSYETTLHLLLSKLSHSVCPMLLWKCEATLTILVMYIYTQRSTPYKRPFIFKSGNREQSVSSTGMKSWVFVEFIYLSLPTARLILCISIAAGSLKWCNRPSIKQYSPVWIDRMRVLQKMEFKAPHQKSTIFTRPGKRTALNGLCSQKKSIYLFWQKWAGASHK